jgi:hypothetical protein
MNAADMMFRGFTDEEICQELWNVGDDERKIRNGKSRLRNLRKNEVFQDFYRSIINEWSVHHVGKALLTIAKQMEDKNAWLANKAANDVITQSKSLITGMEDNSVVIKVEGMPELGTPED